MNNIFERATARILKTLCDNEPIKVRLLTGSEKELFGVFQHPEGDVVVKGRGGSLTIKEAVPKLLIPAGDCPPLSKNLRFTIRGEVYAPIPNKSFDDGAGLMQIALRQTQADEEEGGNNGHRWR